MCARKHCGQARAQLIKLAIFASNTLGGGAERVAVHLAGQLAREGWAVDLVVLQADPAAELPRSVDLVELGVGRARDAIGKLRRYIKRARPDLVIAVGFEQNVAAAIALLGLKRRPALLLTVHAPLDWCLPSRGVRRSLSSRFTRALYRTADRVVAVSKGVARELDGRGWAREPCEVIYNPVLPDDVSELADRSVSHPWLLGKTIPVAVAVGRLSAVKNYPLLLRAFSELRRRVEARLIIVGEGECRQEIEQLIASSGYADSIDLAGAVDNPFPYMRAADVLVLCSQIEGLGNVLIEAMAVGTPVVATDCPYGPREILEDGKWGRLVPAGDAAALAVAIEEALSVPRDAAIARAFEFTASGKSAEYSDLAKRVIAARAGRGR